MLLIINSTSGPVLCCLKVFNYKITQCSLVVIKFKFYWTNLHRINIIR